MKKYILIVLPSLLLIILVLFAIVLIGNLMNYPKPDFNITKEECTDLNKECNKHCIGFCIRSASDSLEKEYKHFNTLKERLDGCFDYNNCCENDCKQVPVDEIEYLTRFSWERNSSVVDLVYNEQGCYKNYNGFIQGCGIYPENLDCCYGRISKQDLTISWLYQNCVCLIFSSGFGASGSFTNKEAMDNCQKYKCEFEENYTVEIL